MKKNGSTDFGVSSVSYACCFEQAGTDVKIFEKNKGIGVRFGFFEKVASGFDIRLTFDGTPDVFGGFFADFNTNTSDYHEVCRSI